MEPLVSIIIPVYNAERHLVECIESALNQTWAHKELILVDDGSTDNSLEIANSFKSASVKIFSQQNSGASVARNTGLKEAKGKYIQFLDADDILSPDKIEAQIKCLNGSLTKVALCATIHFYDGEDYLDKNISREWLYEDNDDPIDFLLKLYSGHEVMPGYGGMVQPNAWLTPMNLIEKAGLWKEYRCPDDDGEFFCRVILASEGIKFSPVGINYYRKFRSGNSLSGQKNKESIESVIESINLKYSYMKAKTNDPILDKVFARHYWWTGVLAYPRFMSLSSYCIKKAKQFGYTGQKYVGGPGGYMVAAMFGWKTARLMSYYKQLLKR